MKKVLLGSTALVAAGLMAGPAFAQLELTISGSVDVHFGFADEDLDIGRRAYGITTDTTLNFNTKGVADNGLEYGSRINVDDTAGDAFKIDETWIFVSGTFGEVRFGATDPAASELIFSIPTVGNGQSDGDFDRYIINDFVKDTDFIYADDDNKIVYIGEFGDVTVAASYSPTDASVGGDPAMGENDGGDVDNVGDLEDIISVGGNFQGDFNGVAIGVSAGINTGDYEQDLVPPAGDLEDLFEFSVGGEVGFGGITAGGFWINSASDLVGGGDVELDRYGIGATFSTGPWAFGANALIAEFEAVDPADDIEDTIVGVGVEYSLADGMTPYADLVFFENDLPGVVDDNEGTVFLVGVEMSF